MLDVEIRIHHLGMLCERLPESLVVYCHKLGQEIRSRSYKPGLIDYTFVGKGSNVSLKLIGKPFTERENEYIQEHGHGLDRIGYLVENVDSAFEKLESRGVQTAWSPVDYHDVRHCGFYDQDGLLFELFNFHPQSRQSLPRVEIPLENSGLRLHHVSILTPDLRASQQFYEEMLGLKTVFELTKDGGGLVFLIDSSFDHWKNNFMVEIIGPPDLEPREVELLEKRGACYDHLCFVAKNVKNAWQAVLNAGMMNMENPRYYYGTCLAWVKDVDDNQVEIMSPMPRVVVDIALETGKPLNAARLFSTAGVFFSYSIEKGADRLKKAVLRWG